MEDKWRSSRPKILHEKHLKVIPLINNSAKKWNRAWEVHFSGASSEKISRSHFKGGEFVIKGQTTQGMNWNSSATGPMDWWIHKFEIRGSNYCQYTWWMSQEMPLFLKTKKEMRGDARLLHSTVRTGTQTKTTIYHRRTHNSVQIETNTRLIVHIMVTTHIWLYFLGQAVLMPFTNFWFFYITIRNIMTPKRDF